ncbi:DUF5753 domain-containing protein [Streptomyces anulatus]|uniref:DUF5753 domain-containing protein n=1 Tax=Streptomyces anulatus TaxID=1892 RepID=UPI00342CB2D3
MAVSTAGMVARRRFGHVLKTVRENAHRSEGGPVMQIDAAKAIKRKTIDRVSRFERGAAWPEVAELEALLKLYEADLETSTRLRTMLAEGQAIGRAWWTEFEDDFPESLIQFIAYESAAEKVTTCAVIGLPALLQTEGYARAMTAGIAGTIMSTNDVERSVELRRKRRVIFDKPTPVEFIFSEAALHQQIGGPEVMYEQLEALLTDSATQPVTLRVIPFAAAATVMHMQHLLEFPGGDEKPIAVMDSQSGMTFQSRQKEVRETTHYIDAMRDMALSSSDSVAMINKFKKEFSRA